MAKPRLPEAAMLTGRAVSLPWLIAAVDVSYGEVTGWLAEPHFVETDPLRTPGGRECHWAFVFPDGMRIGIVLRERYGEAHIFADPPDTAVALRHLAPLLTDHPVRVADPPLRYE